MATGYDNRQATRQSFAFKGAAPTQSRSSASGGSRGVQVIGGESSGGVVTSGQETNAPSLAQSGLGEFFDGVMKPYVERKQIENFYKGFGRAQEGIALDQLTGEGRGMASVFGPTGFEAGAQFYTAQTAVAQFQTATLADMGNLKKLPADEAAKRLAKASQALLTGDPFADQLIQKSLLEGSGPLMNAVAKARFAWGQEVAVQAAETNFAASATALQGTASAQATLSDPDEPGLLALQQSVLTFVQGRGKPEGMTDESYAGYLTNSTIKAAQDGNFYAVSALIKGGLLDALPDDKRKKVEDAVERYGNKALSVAAMDEMPEMIRLGTEMTFGRLSAVDAAKGHMAINQRLRAKTGIDLDLYDYKDIVSKGMTVTQAMHAQLQRQEDKADRRAERAEDRALDRQDKADELAAVAAQVQGAFGGGSVVEALAGGMGKASDYDMLALNARRSGNWTPLIHQFKQGWKSDDTAKLMQGRVEGSIGQGWTADMEGAVNEWASLNKAHGPTAAVYYGKHHIAMQAFDTMVRGGITKEVATLRAFGDPDRYRSSNIPADRRKEVNALVAPAVEDTQSWSLGFQPFGRTNLNAGAVSLITNVLTETVASSIDNTDTRVPALVNEALAVSLSNGSIERYGQHAWRNKANTTPLHRLMGVTLDKADRVIPALIDKRLKAAGFKAGGNADDYDIIRTPRGIYVHGYDDGDTVLTNDFVFITHAELKSAAFAEMEKEREGAIPKPLGSQFIRIDSNSNKARAQSYKDAMKPK